MRQPGNNPGIDTQLLASLFGFTGVAAKVSGATSICMECSVNERLYLHTSVSSGDGLAHHSEGGFEPCDSSSELTRCH